MFYCEAMRHESPDLSVGCIGKLEILKVHIQRLTLKFDPKV